METHRGDVPGPAEDVHAGHRRFGELMTQDRIAAPAGTPRDRVGESPVRDARNGTLDVEPEGNRLNEGAVAPDGGLVVGTMQSNLNPDGIMREMDRQSGAFCRASPEGPVSPLTEPVFGITNTLGRDEREGRMYICDILARTIHAMVWPRKSEDADPETVVRKGGSGMPDGSCLDAEFCLWNVRYGGGAPVRYATGGTEERIFSLPGRNTRACDFGGEGYTTLYLTTALNELDREMATDLHNGSLLALESGVAGTAPHVFGG